MNEKFKHTPEELSVIGAQIRSRLVRMSHESRAAHLGSALSCVDLLVCAYWNILNIEKENCRSEHRDRFILSKGHAAAAIYAVLVKKGILEESLLKTYGHEGALLEEHPGPSGIEGVEAATGSLGHGLSLGVGMALADRLQKKTRQTMVLISDGECNEGSVWEAAMYASGQALANLSVIIDFNKWQATGRSCEVTGLESLIDKWKSFGWNTFEIDGHDMKQSNSAIYQAYTDKTGPCAIVAHTVKGKGVSFMEDDNNWHYRIPTREEVNAANIELGLI